MKHIVRFFWVMVVSVILQGCQGPVATYEEANALALKYLTAINDGNYDEAYGLVSDDFFGSHAKDELIVYHDKIKEIMGPAVSVKLSQSTTDDRFSGRFYMYRFAVRHEDGISMEMITMIEKINSDAPLKIFAHKIDSSRLKKLNANF